MTEAEFDIFEALYAAWVEGKDDPPYMVGVQGDAMILLGMKGQGNYRVKVEVMR